MNDLSKNKESIVRLAKSDMDSLTGMASEFFQLMSDKNKNDRESQKQTIQFREKVLIQNASVFKAKLSVVALGLLCILGIAAGLIFYLKDSSSGLGLLSHTGAAIAGILGGIGYEKSNAKKNG